ncbi:MAG: DNA repair protein RadC [Thermoanaerobaculia bacterium]|nr:DNA repair protein RadC [Thermoanaerobaculia bacterium]
MPLASETIGKNRPRPEPASRSETPERLELRLPAHAQSFQGRPKILDLPRSERPRERLVEGGGEALSDAELLAVLLRSGRPGQSAVEMAQELLAEAGGVAGLVQATLASLNRPGLRQAKAATLLAAVELGRRLARCQLPKRDLLDRPPAVADYLWLRYGGVDQEVMGVLFLDSQNRLRAEREIYRGTRDRIKVEPRAILREALIQRAHATLLFHTHPSGDPTPSIEDLAFTERMREASHIVGVRLADHMIIGHGGSWVSLKRRGAW